VEHLRVQDIEPEEDGTSDLPLLFSEDG